MLLSDLATDLLDFVVEASPEGSTEWCPGLDQQAPIVVFGNHVAGVVGNAVGELVDDRLDGRLFQDAIELLGGEVRNRDALC